MYKTYSKQTYEESLKSKRNAIRNSSYYVKGYCEIPNGILHFQGDIPGVSVAQARYYIIYMMRDVYGSDVWINPIFFSIGKPKQTPKFADREMYFSLKPYQDNMNRSFIKFNTKEIEKQHKDKKEVGDLMPNYYVTDNLPPMKEIYLSGNVDNTSNYYERFIPEFEEVKPETNKNIYDEDYIEDYSIEWLEDMCNLPEGVGLFDDDR